MKILSLLFVLFLFSILSCSDSSTGNEPIPIDPVEPVNYMEITQYADSVIAFSSEYTASPGSWSASKLLGAPDTYPKYGDISTSWASDNRDDQREFLELSFDTLQTVSKIEIYETYNTGAIDTVYLKNPDTNNWDQIWSTTAMDSDSSASNILTIELTETEYLSGEIRIAINSPEVSGWNEIDAVAVSGNYIEEEGD